MPKQRIAVIGGLAAGPAAAAHAKRVDPDAEVVLFEQGPHISYGVCEMPFYVADQIKDAASLLVLTPEQFERTRHVPVQLQQQVLGIHPKRCRLDVKDVATGVIREERFDKFILATGASARRTGLGGEDAPNVFVHRSLNDAEALKTHLETHPVQHAVVLGGGFIGVEIAEALRHRGLRVTMLEPGDGVLHHLVGGEVQQVVHDEMHRQGVAVRQERATGFEQAADGQVRAVRTDRGEKIGCQLVVVAIGITPNARLAQQAGLRIGETGAVAVDAHQRTSAPNVWACGDCAEVARVIDGKKVHLSLAHIAFHTARVAAENATRRGRGTPAMFPGVVVAAGVKVFDLEVAGVGLRLHEAQAAGFDAFAETIRHWTRVRIYPGSQPIHVRYVVERRTGRLLGAELAAQEGAAQRANVLVPLIRNGWSVKDMNALDLIYTPPFAPMHDPLLVAAHKAWKTAQP